MFNLFMLYLCVRQSINCQTVLMLTHLSQITSYPASSKHDGNCWIVEPCLRASSYEPGNQAGPVRGRILSSVHMENLISVTETKNVQKATKIPVEPRSDLSVTLQAMRNWKCFVPVSGLECSYGKNSKNFQLGYRDLGRKNRDLGNRASPPSHMNTSKFL